MLLKILNIAFKQNELIGIRTYDMEYDEAIIGYVLQISDEFFSIRELNENIIWTGKRIIYFDEVMEVFFKDIYQEGLKILLDKMDTIKTDLQISVKARGKRLSTHLNQLLNKNEITTFYFIDEHYTTGILEKMDDNYLYIRNIGSGGNEDGWSCCRIKDLTGFRHNGVEEQRIKILYDFYKNQNIR